MSYYRNQRERNAPETRRVKPTVPVGKRLSLVKGLLMASVMVVSNAVVAAGLEVEPPSHDFGEVLVGSSAEQTFTLINKSNSRLQLGYIGHDFLPLIPTGPDIYISDDPCSNAKMGVAPSPSAICKFTVRFEPHKEAINWENQVEYYVVPYSEELGNPNTLSTDRIEVTGRSIIPTPNLEVEPTSHDFGEVEVSSSSELNVIKIKNTGNGSLNINSINFSGTGAEDFKIITDFCSVKTELKSSKYCSVITQFKPQTDGEKAVDLSILSNDPDTPTLKVQFKSTVLPPKPNIDVSPIAHDFGIVSVGNASRPQTFTIANNGNADLELGALNLDNAEFVLTDSCSNTTIQPLQDCQVTVTFQPQSKGVENATLSISSNDPDTPLWEIKLTANSSYPCTLTPTILSTQSGNWTDPNIWNQGRVPTSTDVVLVSPDNVIRVPQQVNIKGLCNYGEIWNQPNRSLSINTQTNGFISNYGQIRGEDGNAGTGGACGQPGSNISLRNAYSYNAVGGSIYNEGVIRAGNGGNGPNCAGRGGNVYIHGSSGTTNKSQGVICAGNGGNATNGGPGPRGGNGGYTNVWGGRWEGPGRLVNEGLICGGNGGSGYYGGNGGDVGLEALPFLIPGKVYAGGGGAGTYPGRGGRVWIEPMIIDLSGSSTEIRGEDIIIFCGEDCELNLSQMKEGAISATGNITLAVGRESKINLTGNTNKVLQASNGKVEIFADEVLLDRDITLSDVIEAKEIIQDGAKILRLVLLSSPGQLVGEAGTQLPIKLTLANGGPEVDVYSLKVTDSADWSLGTLPELVPLEGLDLIDLILDVTLPSTPGAEDIIMVTAMSLSDPNTAATTEIRIKVITVDTDSNTATVIISTITNACPSTGDIERICENNNEQILTDVTIKSGVNLGGGSLAGVVNNHGMISQAKVQADAIVKGGKMTGYIENEGTLVDIEFVGVEVVGGTLKGDVFNNSKVGGTFRDVSLAANTRIKGGYLADNIQGDCEAPARLENLIIKDGTHISCVILGEGVILGEAVTCGEGVQAEEGVCSDETELPPLGAVVKVQQGETVDTIDSEAALFAGGISVNEGIFEPRVTQSLSDIADIRGHITVLDSDHLGQPAELVAYAAYLPLEALDDEGLQPIYFMLDENYDIPLWENENDLFQLVYFQILDELGETVAVELYQGPFVAPGILNISFGYRLLGDDKVVQNAQTLDVTITADESD